MSNINNSKYKVRLPLIISFTLAAGILIGATMFGGGDKSGVADVFKNALKFREILSYLENNYVDTVNTDELTETAVQKMLESLDPHSSYISAKDVALANADLEGGFDGIGVQFDIVRDTIVVVAPISGGPSEKLGVKSGDKIVEVDGENIAGIGITNYGVFKRLRGKSNTKVKIAVVRRGHKNPIEFTIVRDKIPVYSVDASYMKDKITGYIRVSRFSNTTTEEFITAMNELKAEGMKRLILDLRGNPGGSMEAAEQMSDAFLESGKMIVYTKGRTGRFDRETIAAGGDFFEKGAVVVLMNEGSASASEIVAGALQDNDRALIVGRRSFGKGLVQLPIPLSDDSQLRLTISRYYTPSGRSIQKPYSGDYKAYILESYERRANGETFNEDSVKFDESLKYKTAGGRTVYGGGGIMPDVFIAEDSSHYSNYLFQLTSKDIIRELTIDYVNKNDKKWKKKSIEVFLDTFQVTPEMIDKIKKSADAAGIIFNEEEYLRSEEFIKLQIKAQIASGIWDTEAFYRVWNEWDNDIKKALSVFEEAAMLEEGNF